MRKIASIFLALAVLIPFSQASAHQSGCHRWHSCPSDTGSYVCGDLGYTSGCPKAITTKPKVVAPVVKKAVPVAVKKVTPAPVVKKKVTPVTSTAGKIYVKGYYRSNGTYVNGYWRNK